VTAPIVVQEGSYTEASDIHWQPAGSVVWTTDTTPTNVTVTITDEYGLVQTSSSAFAGDTPSYASLLPVVVTPPSADTTPPMLTVDGLSTIAANDSVTFMVTSDEALAALRVFVDGNELMTGIEKRSDTTWAVTYAPSVVGAYTVVVQGEDTAGNRNDGVVTTVTVTPALPTPEQTSAAGRQLEDAVAALTQPLNTVKDVTQVSFMGDHTPGGSDVAVLGNLAEKSIDTSVSADAPGAVIPTENGWRIFGLLWYWWALIIVAVVVVGGRIVPMLQRRAGNAT
jgi:hypothetical protein